MHLIHGSRRNFSTVACFTRRPDKVGLMNAQSARQRDERLESDCCPSPIVAMLFSGIYVLVQSQRKGV